jgi:hypothetical protein
MRAMRAGTRARRILAAAALVFVIAPPAAFAVTRTVTRVSGSEIAAEAIGRLQGIVIGSEGATVTVATDGRPTDVRVDFAEAVRALERGESPGWLRLAALPLAAGAVLKLLGFLARLGRG